MSNYDWYPYDSEVFVDGWDFERYCAELLKNNGYHDVKLTAHNDYGVDITAFKGKVYLAFQCKYRSSPKDKIITSAVQEIYTGKALYKADKGVLISNVDPTRPAARAARELGIDIWCEYYLRLLSAN